MCCHGALARYVKLWVAHAAGMPGTFSPPLRFSDPDMHHGTCMRHVPWCMSGSLTRGFLCSRRQGKCSWHFRRMCNLTFYVSGRRCMAWATMFCDLITSHWITAMWSFHYISIRQKLLVERAPHQFYPYILHLHPGNQTIGPVLAMETWG